MGALRLVLDVSSHSYMETALIQAWVAPHKGVPVPWQGALLRTSQLSHPTEEQVTQRNRQGKRWRERQELI